MEPIEPTFTVQPPARSSPQLPKPKRGGFFGLLAAFGALLFKIAGPAVIVLKTGGTMLLSIAAYSIGFGWSWKMAGGVVVLILVHEMGHFVVARCYGIAVSAPMFIPFFGAYVMLKNRPLDPYANAIISYAGPLFGGIGGWACYGLGLQLDWPWLSAVAFYTFLLNLFNLLPIPGFDGSHIWITFLRSWTPQMSFSDRCYMGIFLAGLIAGMLLGGLHSYRAMHALS